MDLQKLAQLRGEIDRIDDDIHHLIMERSKLAMQIGQSKGVLDRTAIRPAREAFIHRRLFERHGGVFPYDALMRMWREMINGFTLLQSNYTVAVLWQDNDKSHNTRCWDLARDQFGTRVHIDTYGTDNDVLQAVLQSKFVIGVLPRPDAVSRQTPWWVQLADLTGQLGDDAPRVLFRLPYAGMCQSPSLQTTNAHYDAYAIAPIAFEKTGLDVSVVVVQLQTPIDDINHGAGGLIEVLSSHFTSDVQLVSISPCGGYAMVEIYDYVTDDDSRLSNITGIRTSIGIGGYADMSAINHALNEHPDEQ